MPMLFGTLGATGSNFSWNSRANKDNINEARYVLENKCTCFCRPDDSATRWKNFKDVVDWLCKQGDYTNRTGEAMPIGDCNGLWTNRPSRDPRGVLYGSLLDTEPEYPEIVQELIAVCSVLLTCGGSGPIILRYTRCLGGQTSHVWTMAPIGFRDKLVFCGKPGAGSVSGFWCHCNYEYGIGGLDWMVPDELTPFSLAALKAAAPSGIKLFGKTCYYLSRVARIDAFEDCEEVWDCGGSPVVPYDTGSYYGR